jgi:hypothetical protein
MKRATRLKRNVTPFYPAVVGGQRERGGEERNLKITLRNYVINTVHRHKKRRAK